VAEAQRGLELELSRLGLKEMPARGATLDLSRVPSVLRARNLEENARSVLDRARRLGSGRIISPEELERVQTEYRVARAGREHAELESHTYLAAARQKFAQLETARQKLLDTCVRVPCPSPGRMPPGLSNPKEVRYVVAARKVAEGEMIRIFPAQGLFRLVIDAPLKLVVTVPERFFAEIKLGQDVALHVESYPDHTFAGQVARINPTIDRGNRTFTLEVLVVNTDKRLRPGSFAKASIRTRQDDRTLTVPEEAIVRFAGVVKVFVIENGKARAVEVRTGEAVTVLSAGRPQRWVEVAGALKPGDRVVTSGQATLSDQTAVRVR
jgi:multidrug efflux pump subunit AcrA (membrane-fusion protein)